MNSLNYITSPCRFQSQTKHWWITINSRRKIQTRCKTLRISTLTERKCAKRVPHSVAVYRAWVTLYPIGRRLETSWSRRHSVAGAASPRDHEVSTCRPIERRLDCRCSKFEKPSMLYNARFSNKIVYFKLYLVHINYTFTH